MSEPERTDEPQFRQPEPTQRNDRRSYECAVCHNPLKAHERPQRGLPGLCDDCARTHSWSTS